MYEISAELKSNMAAYATTLKKMYELPVSYPASLSPWQGDFLRSFICATSPQTVLEVGCYIGISSIWMAAGLCQADAGGVLHSIDKFGHINPWLPHFSEPLAEPLKLAKSYVEQAGLADVVHFHKGLSGEVGKQVADALPKGIDLLFIDGDHTAEGCEADFNLFSPYVNKGGYIILHDIYPEHCGWHGPRELIDKRLKGNAAYELLEIKTTPVNYGMAIVRVL